MNRFFAPANFVMVLVLLLFSCGGDEPGAEESCTGPLCPFIGKWSLTKVEANGESVQDNLGTYKLELKKPGSDPNVGSYTRTDLGGVTDSGTWSLANNNDVLILATPDGNEEYIVSGSVGSSLVLILNRQPEKPGPTQIKYTFKK